MDSPCIMSVDTGRSTYAPPARSVAIPVHHSTSVPGTTYGGVGTAVNLAQATGNAAACAAGFHAWVPWLKLEGGSWVSWCCRPGCGHHEQYDAPAAAGSPGTGTEMDQ